MEKKNLSISVGYSIRKTLEDIELVYKDADNMMYMDKTNFYKKRKR